MKKALINSIDVLIELLIHIIMTKRDYKFNPIVD